MKLKKNLKYGASALALALLLSACSGDNAQEAKEDAKDAASNAKAAVSEEVNSVEDKVEDKKEEKKEEKNQEAAARGIENQEFKVSLTDAVDKFKEAFAEDGIEVESVELDEDDGKFVYDVQGFKDNNEYEATIDAETGEVLSQEQDQDDDTQDDIAIDFASIITPEDAMQKALENNKGYVKGWELEHSDDYGKLVYDIDIEDGDDVAIDAETGDIVEK